MMFTAEEKLIAVKREIGFRKRLYPRWVDAGRMKIDQAEYGIAIMEAIADDYAKQTASERLL